MTELKGMTTSLRTLFLVIGSICLACAHVHAQNPLDRKISIDANNQRLSDVLKAISIKGDFYFSYNSNIIRRDSLVSVSVYNKPVRQVLDQLFGNQFTYEQNNNYIILHKTVVPLPAQSPSPSEEKLYTVTGFIMNGETGESVSNASIYEKQRLVSTLSDDKGFFKIRLKSRYSTASLTISREMFEDTTVVIQPKYNQQVTIVMNPAEASRPIVTISPVDDDLSDTIVIKSPDSLTSPALLQEVNQVEKTRWARFLLSAQQNIRSINLKKFFADRTFQVSLLPGVGTHGKLSPQVTNSFSVNVIGGYTAGVTGIELGGAFNINKKDVQYMQAAGILNIVGGSMNGVQLAGWHNNVLKNAAGVQASGISNFVKGNVAGVQMSSIYNHVGGSLAGLQATSISNYVNGKVSGVQLSGIHNHASDSVTGFQAAGITNFARKSVTGAQLAGIANVTNGTMTGIQLSHFFNYAKVLRGVQIGIVNIADTSDGYSIGIVNVVLKGYHKLIFYTNETLDANVAFKTGNRKLYSLLLFGTKLFDSDSIRTFSIGYGLGREIPITKKFSISPEFTTQYLYMGSWKGNNVMNKLHVQFTWKLFKNVSVFAGPSFTTFYTEQSGKLSEARKQVPSSSYHTFNLWNNGVKGWVGWNAGISLF